MCGQFKILILIQVFILLLGCQYSEEIPECCVGSLREPLKLSRQNAKQLKESFKDVSDDQKKAVCFLLCNMPESDLKSLSHELIVDNVEYAWKVKDFSWTHSIPDSIFLNYILPYSVMNENRENWRPTLYEKLKGLVVDCNSLEQVVEKVNYYLPKLTGVEFMPDSSNYIGGPLESIHNGGASGVGLSVLLVDAFRSVGVPARIVGVESQKGNRFLWCEVWIENHWYFTDYYGSGINANWFVTLLNSNDSIGDVRFYATIFQQSELEFPFAKASNSNTIPAVDVTDYYSEFIRQHQNEKRQLSKTVSVKIYMFKEMICSLEGDNLLAVQVDIWKEDNKIASGYTVGSNSDLMHPLEFRLDKENDYSVTFIDAKGQLISSTFRTTDAPVVLKLFYE